jgi:hypothetical protein
MQRRRFLATAGIALTVSGAGCLGGPGDDTVEPQGTDEPTTDPSSPRSVTDDRTTDQNGSSDDGTDDEIMTTESTLRTTETIPFAASNEPTDWDSETSTGRVVVIDSEARARAALPITTVPEDHHQAVSDFVSETDFEDSVLVFVESAGPNSCYGELAIEDVTLSESSLTGSATAVDGSEDRMCAEVLTFPSALLRATFDGSPHSTVTMTVTNGWDDSEEITATTSDPLSVAPDELPGYVQPDGEPPAVPDPLTCDGEFNRHPNWAEDPPWGNVEHDGETAFALRVDRKKVSYGETVTVSLTNVSDEQLSTGNRYKYSLQVETTDGWQDVRGARDKEHFEYTDEALIHRPGEGLQWTFEMTESGVVADHFHDLTVCPDLQTGRYRFVFFEPAVAVAFDLER